MTIKETIEEAKKVGVKDMSWKAWFMIVTIISAAAVASYYGVNVTMNIDLNTRLSMVEGLLTQPINSTFYTLQKESNYIVSVVKSGATTYYTLQNGTDSTLQWYSTNKTALHVAAAGNLTDGGTIYCKNQTWTSTITLLDTVTVIESYNGAICYYGKTALGISSYTFLIDVSGSTYRAWHGANSTLFTSSTNLTLVEQFANGNLTSAGGLIWLKEVQHNTSLALGNNVLVIESYNGTLRSWSNQGKGFLLARLAADPSTAGWGDAEAPFWWYNYNEDTIKYWNGTGVVIIPSIGGGSINTYTLGPTFTIYKTGSTYYAEKSNGATAYSSSNMTYVLQQIINNYDGWWVQFTNGTFTFTQAVVFGAESNFMITGAGFSTILQLGANIGTGVDFWSFSHTVLASGRFTIRDVQFDLQGTTYTSRDALSIFGGERWFLDHIKILRPYRDGLCVDENGGNGYTRYDTTFNLQVYYAGRYGIFDDARDINFYDTQVEYSYDSNVYVGAAGAGNYWSKLHATGAHNTAQTIYTSQAGGGNGNYAGLEVAGSGNHFDGVYLDRDNKSGAYITGDTNVLDGGRVYECNYNAGASANYDVYISGVHNRVIGMELNGQASYPTLYGVYLDSTADNNTVVGNAIWDHPGAIYNGGNYNQISANAGFVTENSGTLVTCYSGNWTNHGLAGTPQLVLVQYKGNSNSLTITANATSATQFQIRVWNVTSNTEYTGAISYAYWLAIYKP